MNLVLGHGHNYDKIDKYNPQCLTITKDEWKIKKNDGKLMFIDIDETCDPDIVLDLETKWVVFPDNYTDTIIDTTGVASGSFNKIFWDEVYRVLKPGGCIFSRNHRCFHPGSSISSNIPEKFEKELINENVMKLRKPDI